jgi:hypothetical protein
MKRTLTWVSVALLYIAEQLFEPPRLWGVYVTSYVIVPLLVLGSISLHPKTWERLAGWYGRFREHQLAVALPTGFVVNGLLLGALLVYLNYPASQPKGHGQLAGSLPLPALHVFPIPDKLPPPEVVERKLPAREKMPPPVNELRIEDVIAQLPVEAVVENEMAPYSANVPVAPSAPFNLTLHP